MFDDAGLQAWRADAARAAPRIGDERFFALLRDWTAQHRHATVTTAQFVELAGRHAVTDLAPFFTDWLHRPVLPQLPA